MSTSCTINGIFFKTKAALKGYLKPMVASYKDGEFVSKEDFSFLMELLKYHKDYKSKTSKEVKNIKADKSPWYDGPKTRCFYLLYVDGEYMKFSYVECLKGI